jgi:hypothetical protein
MQRDGPWFSSLWNGNAATPTPVLAPLGSGYRLNDSVSAEGNNRFSYGLFAQPYPGNLIPMPAALSGGITPGDSLRFAPSPAPKPGGVAAEGYKQPSALSW